ncbi:MAG: 23S rRNA (guanosine(2251)-2'-O)-methyltransferase RlmB [Candidatus Thermoplasmatota archaeon]|nr:23S rRNA (guanosine(2251)-2'-O)-methyltransferase RlmB [Candidatus Thermoplasmatota archaeon]
MKTVEKTTIVFGIHAAEELLESRSNQIDHFYFSDKLPNKNIFHLIKEARKKKIPFHCIPVQKLNLIAKTTKHQGVVAICAIKNYETIQNVLQTAKTSNRPPLFIIPAALQDPHNFGALIRSSVAFGVTAILVEWKGSAPLSSTVAKTSAGMVEHLPIVKPTNMEMEIKQLRDECGFSIIGVSEEGTKKPFEVDMSGPTILVMGGEHRGIPPYLRKLCSEYVGIPMQPPASSLNITVAASVMLYECAKQRKFYD